MFAVLLFVAAVLVVALVALAWRSSPVPTGETEIACCADCVPELVRRGGVRFVRKPGEPFREMAWGTVCVSHPTERIAQATNFVTVDRSVVHAMTAPRRGPLAPFRRLVRAVQVKLWWRKVLRQGTEGGGQW